MTSKTLALLSSTLLLTACVTKPISPEAANVQVHRQGSSLLADCRKLGPVSGYGSKPLGNAIGSRGALTEAVGNLREETYAKSGDSVAIVNQEESVSELRVLGIAYKCF